MESASVEDEGRDAPVPANAVHAGPYAIAQDYGNFPMAVIHCLEEPALFGEQGLRSALHEMRTYTDYCGELLKQLADQPASMHGTHDADVLREARRNPSEECRELDRLAKELQTFAALRPEELTSADIRAIIYRTAIDAMRITHPEFRMGAQGVTAPPRSPEDRTPAEAPRTHPGT